MRQSHLHLYEDDNQDDHEEDQDDVQDDHDDDKDNDQDGHDDDQGEVVLPSSL